MQSLNTKPINPPENRAPRRKRRPCDSNLITRDRTRACAGFIFSGFLWAWCMGGGPVRADRAIFHVTSEVVNENPGAFTATTGPKRILVDFNFEPLIFRQQYQVVEAGTGRVYAGNLHHFDVYAPGFWDGAGVRAFRVSDGTLSQVYAGEVIEYHSGMWRPVGGQRLVPAFDAAGDPVTEAAFVFDGWEKQPAEWWITMQAVDEAGNASGLAEPVRFINPEPTGRRAEPDAVFTVNHPDQRESDSPPAAPQGLAIHADQASGLLTLTWDAPRDASLVGYRVQRSYRPPHTHVDREYLEVTPGPDGQPFAFRESDLLFLDLERHDFDINLFSPRVHGTHEVNRFRPGFRPMFYPRPRAPGREVPYHLVPHDDALGGLDVPHGQTSMQFEPPAEEGFTRIAVYNHADTEQNWYQVLDPDKTYVVEFLARQTGNPEPRAVFGFTGRLAGEVEIEFELSPEWNHYYAQFSVDTFLTNSGHVGEMFLDFFGPGTAWIDNFRVYEKEEGLTRWCPADQAALRASGMASIRTHDTVKTSGYTLDNLLGHPDLGLNSGRAVYSRGNLSALLREMKQLDVFPWLQIEFTLDEDEWLGLVEYIAAPYDPAVDTPEEKPWAARRYAHGQAAPYHTVFDRILFEFSNEVWNRIMPFNLAHVRMTDAVTGQEYHAGEVYGLLQEYTIGVMQRSPYWDEEMAARSEFVIGGWAVNDFGQQAIRHSPSSTHVLISDYNGGWDAGEGPSTDLEDALLKTLNFSAQASWPNTVRLRKTRDAFYKETGIYYETGTYEAGPGYNLDGLNNVRMTPEMVEFESQVMKSLAAGTATLDAFLNHATQGAKLQNFFTFGRNRHYWTSHAVFRNGGQAYPSWLALSLFNNEGQGDLLNVLAEQVPTRLAEAVGRRPEMAHMPEVAVHASRTDDRLTVFVLSRRLKGSVPVKLHLPITEAAAVTLHRLAGDPRAHNLDAKNIAPEKIPLAPDLFARSFVIDDATGGVNGGLPPAATYVYVFEGVTFADEAPRAFLVPQPGQAQVTGELPLRFRAGFSQAMDLLKTDSFQVTGTSEPIAYQVIPVPGYYHQAYDIKVTDVLSEGTARLALAPGVTTAAGRPVEATAAEITIQFPADILFDLLAWNIYRADPEDRDFSDRELTPTTRLPIVQPTALSDEGSGFFGNNPYYNDGGFGAHVRAGQMADREYAVRFTLAPAAGRVLQVDEIMVGLWFYTVRDSDPADADYRAMLEVWQHGERVARVPFEPEVPVPYERNLGSDAGTPAYADVRHIAALQQLTEAVDLRIVVGGLNEVNSVFGLGKIGRDRHDLSVRGRLLP